MCLFLSLYEQNIDINLKITSQMHVATRIVNLVERMKRQRMKRQRMKRQLMKRQRMKRQRMKRQRMKRQHTATDWPKRFCIYRLKCSKARVDGWTVGGKSPGDPILRAPAVLIIRSYESNADVELRYICKGRRRN